MPRFSASCLLQATPDELYRFHARPANLQTMLPPGMRLVSLQADPDAVQGGVMRLKITALGIFTMHWTGRWKEVQSPHLLADEILEGPFKSFVHEHRFTRMDAHTARIEDVVSCEMGAGIMDRLAETMLQHVVLPLMFAWRHGRMRRLVRHGCLQDASAP